MRRGRTWRGRRGRRGTGERGQASTERSTRRSAAGRASSPAAPPERRRAHRCSAAWRPERRRDASSSPPPGSSASGSSATLDLISLALRRPLSRSHSGPCVASVSGCRACPLLLLLLVIRGREEATQAREAPPHAVHLAGAYTSCLTVGLTGPWARASGGSAVSVEPLGPARVWSAGKGWEGGGDWRAFKGGKKREGFRVCFGLGSGQNLAGAGGVAVAAQRPAEPPAAVLLPSQAKSPPLQRQVASSILLTHIVRSPVKFPSSYQNRTVLFPGENPCVRSRPLARMLARSYARVDDDAMRRSHCCGTVACGLICYLSIAVEWRARLVLRGGRVRELSSFLFWGQGDFVDVPGRPLLPGRACCRRNRTAWLRSVWLAPPVSRRPQASMAGRDGDPATPCTQRTRGEPEESRARPH
jgi:hypothetical protein